MPKGRCRNYNDEGDKLGRCPPDCTWVHPWDPGWYATSRITPVSGSKFRGRGRGRGGPPGLGRLNQPSSFSSSVSSYSDSPRVASLTREREKEKDTSKASGSADWTDLGSWGHAKDNGWGSGSGSGTKNESAGGSTSALAWAEGGWGSASGWGSGDAGRGDKGKGKEKEKETATVGGWGSAASNWGGWGSNDAGAGEGKGKEKQTETVGGWGDLSTSAGGWATASTGAGGWGTAEAGGGWGTAAPDTTSTTGSSAWGAAAPATTIAAGSSTWGSKISTTTNDAGGWGSASAAPSASAWGGISTPTTADASKANTKIPTDPQVRSRSQSTVNQVEDVLPRPQKSKDELKAWFELEQNKQQSEQAKPRLTVDVEKTKVGKGGDMLSSLQSTTPTRASSLAAHSDLTGTDSKGGASGSLNDGDSRPTSRYASPVSQERERSRRVRITGEVPEGVGRRREVWKEIGRLMQRATRVQMELEHAEQAKERWKKTQLSRTYQSAGRAAAARLDAVRNQYEKRIGECKKELTRHLSSLVDAMPMADLVPDFSMVSDRKYVDEINGWVEEVKALMSALTSELSEESANEGDGMDVDQLGPRAEQGEDELGWTSALDPETAKRLREARDWLDQLDSTLALVDGLGPDREVVEDHVETKIVADSLSLSQAQDPQNVLNAFKLELDADDPLFGLTARANRVGEDLEDLANETAGVVREQDDARRVLDGARTNVGTLSTFNARVEKRSAELDSGVEEVAFLLKQLKERVAGIEESRKRSAVNVDEALKSLTSVVLENVGGDLRPELGKVRQQTVNHVSKEKETMYADVWSHLQPAYEVVASVQVVLKEQTMKE